jgi:hypothetical protein
LYICGLMTIDQFLTENFVFYYLVKDDTMLVSPKTDMGEMCLELTYTGQKQLPFCEYNKTRLYIDMSGIYTTYNKFYSHERLRYQIKFSKLQELCHSNII